MKTLIIYIKINLDNNVRRFFKFSARNPIIFMCKPNRSLELYINHQDFNNFIMKNQYSQPLIRELFDWLSQAKRFIQFDLISAYHEMQVCIKNE